MGFFGLVGGEVKSSYKGSVSYEQGFLQVRAEMETWTYEKRFEAQVAPHSTTEITLTWKQADNVKIPYTAVVSELDTQVRLRP